MPEVFMLNNGWPSRVTTITPPSPPRIAAETADIRDDRIDLFLRLRCF